MSGVPITYQERVAMPMGPAVRPGAAAAATFSPADLLGVIKQRFFLILFVWLFFIAATVGGTYMWAKYYPRYDATARVYVESPNPRMPFELGQAQGQFTQETVQRMLLDQVVIVESEDVLNAVLSDSAVMLTDWYKSFPEVDRPRLPKELQEALAVAPIQGTAYLAITMGTRKIDDPHVIVNAVVEKYLNRVNTENREKLNNQKSEYVEERRRLELALKDLRAQKDEFVLKQLSTPGAISGLSYVGDALSRVTQEVALLEAEQTRYRTLTDTLNGAQQLTLSPDMQLMIENDPRVSQYSSQLANLQAELTQATFGKNHPVRKELEARVEAVQEQLTRETATKQDMVRQFEKNQAEMNYLSATEALLQLREKKIDLESQQRDLDQRLEEYKNRNQDIEETKLNLDQVNAYVRMLDMITQQQSIVRVSRLGSAPKPIERAMPKWLVNVPVGTFMGLVIAVGLALLLEFSDTTVRTPRDIVRHMRVPILGTVPDVDDEEVSIEHVELAAQTSPRSMIAEAFRNIRTNLLLSAPAERQRTILIVSPKPEDGKTTVATNLGISIAQSGRRVLLVDANFRRPGLQRVFPEGPRLGLCNALIGQVRLEELVHKTSLPNLDLIFAGPIPPNPAELLGGAYMREFIAQATQSYDQVIFDGPPVLLASDALVLAGLVDGVVLVCRAKVSSRGVAQRARDQLERVRAHMFGAVLNAAQARRGGYFREQLRTFYDYQPEELAGGEPPMSLPGDALHKT